MGRVAKLVWSGPFLALCLLVVPNSALAREINYDGGEVTVYVKPGEPTQVEFPSAIQGGFRKGNSAVLLEKQEKYLVVFAQPKLLEDGEVIIVHLNDSRTYSVRFKPSTEETQRDGSVLINDTRPPPPPEEGEDVPSLKKEGFAPPSLVAGLMRQMILIAEFGKRKEIPGYRRSNRYSGEVILHDGTMEAKIDEIYIGTNFWGYVLSVENKLDTNQVINPATFRLDGTRAVVFSKTQLSPKPLTAEQKISGAHKGKVYVITKAKRL